MDPYSRVDVIFPATVWLEGAGDIGTILQAIAAYLERHEHSTPEQEYLNTCDLNSTGRPDHNAVGIFKRAYLNVIYVLEGREVLSARIICKENCLILELLCHHKYNTIFYPLDLL